MDSRAEHSSAAEAPKLTLATDEVGRDGGPDKTRSAASAHLVTLAHSVPGRLRIKAASAQGDQPALAELQGALSALPGAEKVEARILTGSLIVHFAVARSTEFLDAFRRWLHAHNRRAAREAGAYASAPTRSLALVSPPRPALDAPYSRGYGATVELLQSVDRGIRVTSGNAVDLKVVLALGLVGATFLYIGAEAATPMWVTLGLFGVNHFIETRQGALRADPVR